MSKTDQPYRAGPAAGLLVPVVCGYVLSCSCGSSGPPDPSDLLQAGGTWQGYEEVLHATPEGNCLADAQNANQGARGQYVARIQQSGSSVELVLEFTGNGLTDSFQGTVTTTTLDADNVSPPRQGDFVCDGRPVLVRTAGSHLALMGDSHRLSGTLTGDQELVDPVSGTVLSRITLEEVAAFSR